MTSRVYKKCKFVGGCWDDQWHEVLTDENGEMPATFDVKYGCAMLRYQLKVYHEQDCNSVRYFYVWGCK